MRIYPPRPLATAWEAQVGDFCLRVPFRRYGGPFRGFKLYRESRLDADVRRGGGRVVYALALGALVFALVYGVLTEQWASLVLFGPVLLLFVFLRPGDFQ